MTTKFFRDKINPAFQSIFSTFFFDIIKDGVVVCLKNIWIEQALL